MDRGDVFTFLVGGRAGAGVKKAGSVASNLFSSMGRYVFQMDDYQSLIRGGHNFVVTSTSTRPVLSHYMKADVVVALDARSLETHRSHVREGGFLVYNSEDAGDGPQAPDGVTAVGVPITTESSKHPNPELRSALTGPAALAALIGLSADDLGQLIEREYRRDLEINTAFARSVYDAVATTAGAAFKVEAGDGTRPLITGNEAISLGAVAAGLDLYFAYPMTPSSTILHFLAGHEKELGVTVMHPESEIAAANIAIGAASMGARAMVGTSGGGFALMEEAISLAGMAEVPLLSVLSSRPGPSTGVPTYTEQADLRFALAQGHGDFARVVASPGSVGEAFRLAAEMLALVWDLQIQGILLTEKHLSESRVSADIDAGAAAWAEPRMHPGGDYKRYAGTDDGVSPMLFPPSDELIKWTSYEHDELGITTEDGTAIAAMHDKRGRKIQTLIDRLKGMTTVNRHGDKGPVVFAYGSTTLSVLEALRVGGIEARVVQPVYLEPFPDWELEEFRGAGAVVVEQSSTGQFTSLLRDKLALDDPAAIKRYDGRPFEPEELAEELARALT
ncbi:MAG: 2-oxoacid:acceptor oxidoreductase subunit alpha [Candidatus Eisenbacteria bacterium]